MIQFDIFERLVRGVCRRGREVAQPPTRNMIISVFPHTPDFSNAITVLYNYCSIPYYLF